MAVGEHSAIDSGQGGGHNGASHLVIKSVGGRVFIEDEIWKDKWADYRVIILATDPEMLTKAKLVGPGDRVHQDRVAFLPTSGNLLVNLPLDQRPHLHGHIDIAVGHHSNSLDGALIIAYQRNWRPVTTRPTGLDPSESVLQGGPN